MSPTNSSYLLTEDLSEKIEGLRHLGFKTPDPDSSFFEDIQKDLAANLQRAIGDENRVVRLKMRDIADEVLGKISGLYGDDVFVVSTCPEIAHPSYGASVEINRLVDSYGTPIGLGPRPGHPDLQTQFEKIKRQSASKGQDVRIVVAEDGVFKGETMTSVVKGLQKAGVNVVGVVAGFSYDQAQLPILEEELGIKIDVVEHFGTVLDWVPDHDFLPFTPGCGKVLGVKFGLRLSPFYSKELATFCMPYISPYSPVSQWASIPEENVKSFSKSCRLLALGIFQELESLNKETIEIERILHSKQRVSIPIPLDVEGKEFSYRFPEKKSRVKAVLSREIPKI